MRQAYDHVRRGGTAVILGIGSADDKVEFQRLRSRVDIEAVRGVHVRLRDVRRDFARLHQACGERAGSTSTRLSRISTPSRRSTTPSGHARGQRIRQVIRFA